MTCCQSRQGKKNKKQLNSGAYFIAGALNTVNLSRVAVEVMVQTRQTCKEKKRKKDRFGCRKIQKDKS